MDWKWIATPVLLFLAARFLLKKKPVSYKSKTVIVTGASSGIGEQLALQLAKQGARLVLAARRIDKLNELVERCKELGAQSIAVKADVTNEQDCKHLIESAIGEFKGIDLLILNAGQGCLLKVSEMKDMEPLRSTMDTNFWGYVYPTVHALPYLRNSRGTILAVSSLAAKIPTPRRSIYGASKAAVENFLDCLRTEEPHIQVTIVSPGFIHSEFHEKAFSEGPIKREHNKFMTTETAAQWIIQTAAEGKRERIMTLSGKWGAKLRPLFPALVDSLAKKKAEASIAK